MKILILILLIVLTSLAQANESVETIGRIFIDKKTNEVYFFYLDNDTDMAYPISIKSKKELSELKKLNKKWVKIKGNIKSVREIIVETPRDLLKLDIDELEEFELTKLGFSPMKNKSRIAEINYSVLERGKKQATGGGIAISDETANTLIATAGTVIGVALGPAALIPAGVFGLKALFLDD